MNASQYKTYDPGAKLGRIPAACQRYSMNRQAIVREAEKCGALIRMGRIIFIEYDTMDAHFKDLAKK